MADDLRAERWLKTGGSIAAGKPMGTSQHTKAAERAKKAVEALLASPVSAPLTAEFGPDAG